MGDYTPLFDSANFDRCCDLNFAQDTQLPKAGYVPFHRETRKLAAAILWSKSRSMSEQLQEIILRMPPASRRWPSLKRKTKNKIARERSILIHEKLSANSCYFEASQLSVTDPAGSFYVVEDRSLVKSSHMDGVGRLWSETVSERFVAIAAHELDPQA